MKTARRFLMYGIPKSLLFKIILFLVILLIGKNVFAQDFSVGSSITAPTCTNSSNCSGGHYTALENYEYGSQSVYTIGTRYTGRLSEIKFNVPLPSNWTDGTCFATGDLSYTLTLNMATNDWRNHFSRPFISSSSSGTNWATSNVVFVSKQKIYFNFKIPNDDNTCVQFLYVRLYSPDVSDVSFTGVSNWNLSSVTLSTNFSGSSSSGSSGGSSGGSTSSNQDIINNNNTNTNNIINNNTENTNNIIDNANQNTQDIINNQTDLNYICKKTTNKDNFKFKTGYYYENNGNLIPANSYYYASDFIHISGTTLTFTGITGTNYHLLFYDKNYNLIQNGLGLSSTTYNLPSSVYYIKFSLNSTNYQNFSMYTDECVYIDKSLNISNSIDNVNDTLTNSDVDNGTGSDFFNSFNTSDNGGISGIITKPLVLINSLLDNNDSCSPLNFSITFPGQEAKNVSFPSGCILWNEVPSTVINLYQIIIVGFSSYYLLKRLFKDVEDLKNPEKDEVEVIDL